MHRRIPFNSTVRRRLFAEDVDINRQAQNDNFLNIQQEIIEGDRKRSILKWNFDIQNEIPLEGVYEWYKRDGSSWIGVNTKIAIDPEEKDELLADDILTIRSENESTPKIDKVESVPVLRKRRVQKDENELLGKENGVRRKISFD